MNRVRLTTATHRRRILNQAQDILDQISDLTIRIQDAADDRHMTGLTVADADRLRVAAARLVAVVETYVAKTEPMFNPES